MKKLTTQTPSTVLGGLISLTLLMTPVPAFAGKIQQNRAKVNLQKAMKTKNAAIIFNAVKAAKVAGKNRK